MSSAAGGLLIFKSLYLTLNVYILIRWFKTQQSLAGLALRLRWSAVATGIGIFLLALNYLHFDNLSSVMGPFLAAYLIFVVVLIPLVFLFFPGLSRYIADAYLKRRGR
jgi:hypothetical protein